MKCIVCRDARHVVSTQLAAPDEGSPGGTVRLAKCRRCGLGFLEPQPSSQALDRFYENPGYQRDGSIFGGLMDRVLDIISRNRVRRLGAAGALLDVGCGKGRFLTQAIRLGWRAEGIEPSERTAQLARTRSRAPVLVGVFDQNTFREGRWTAATMWHVLEHVRDPDAVLSELRRLLPPGSTVGLAIPNWGSVQARIFGAHWFHLQLPGHLYHYSPGALTRLLARHGFQVTRRKRFSLDCGYFAMLASLANVLARRQDYLVNALKPGESGRARAMRGAALLACITALGIPLLLLETVASAIGFGGELEIYAVRQA